MAMGELRPFRIESAPQGIGEKIQGQHEAKKSQRCGGDIPPHNRLPAQFTARAVDHLSPARGADGRADTEIA